MSRLRQVFSDMAVLKRPERTKFFSDLSLPSYMRDWLVMKFSDDAGEIDYAGVARYIKKYIPSREDYEHLKFQMVNGERVRFLARIRVGIDIKSGTAIFELPDFGGTKTGAGGEVSRHVIGEWQDELLRESENWGIVDLIWTQDYSKNPPRGYINMVGYQPFCPYKVDLDFYKDARRQFSTEDWLDIIIGAADYNPDGYATERQKLHFIRRLLPFVERRINLIELAPMGTGKSYIYEKISKRGWLVSSGTITRAALLYDNNKKTGGLITQFDYVAFDEIQSLRFAQPEEIQAALKSYMEFGEVKGFDTQIVADAGIVVLGNIDAKKFSLEVNMVDEINPMFREAAILDRFHGFIPGWEIPRFHTGIIADGWALNTEYFAEVLHELRTELQYSALVDELLQVPPKADGRDVTAITRICTGFVKLLFPHAKKPGDITKAEFLKYCLQPAVEMRRIIKKQLCILAPQEFDVDGKRDVPNILYNTNLE